ncbi:MAG: hypothetical protein JNJ88_12700 [Planctomycetes bacterium]|nr:hypothetical protein [Planctomycetota bacterium]
MRRLAAAALGIALTSCASSGRLNREFTESEAVRVEVRDSELLVDGRAVSLDELGLAARAAHDQHGGSVFTALLMVRMERRDEEPQGEFERRRDARKNEVLEALIAAGVRSVQLGPPAPPPK